MAVSSSGNNEPKSTTKVTWQPDWRELDLVFGLAVDGAGGSTLLDPAAYASVPRDGIQLADVTVLGSAATDRVYAGVGSTVDVGPGNDELFNTASLGDNLLVGGIGSDLFFLRPVNDVVIGGQLLTGAAGLGLSPFTALVDQVQDTFLIDSSDPGSGGALQIQDFELGVDVLLVDGVAAEGGWSAIRQQLQTLGITANAAPQLNTPLIALSLLPGVEVSRDLSSLASDPDGNPLQLVKLEAPAWITTSGTTVKATAPVGVTQEQLDALKLRLAFSDGQAAMPLAAQLTLNAPPVVTSATTASVPENSTGIAYQATASDPDAATTLSWSLAGNDAALFNINSTTGAVSFKASPNFEAPADNGANNLYDITVTAFDGSLSSEPKAVAISVTNVNEAPKALNLANTVSSLAENTSTSNRIKVADIVITDDALGTNRISLSGPDAASFEVIGTDLFLKAGISLDYETKAYYSLTLSASDPSLPGSNPVSTAFALGLISFIAPPPSAIWDLPGSNSSSVATWTGNPSQVDGSKPVQVGGIGNTWTTTDAPAGSMNQVVLSGKNNTLNVSAGQAQIQSIGQGNAIEAVQQLGDATKIISTGSFGAGTESPPPPIVNAAASTTGNVIGQIATIDAMAGGMTPGSGFYSYATGGTGNDLLYGSVFSDFFRGGMGNDTIIAYAGNDIVRGGAGSDQITLGSGNDKIYYTFDQLQNGDIDTVTDFNAIAGEVDILAIQADRVGGAGNYGSFRGFGTNSLSITDSDGSVTTVVAQAGYEWKQADIFFGV